MTRGWRGSVPCRPVFNAGSVPLSPSGPSVSLPLSLSLSTCSQLPPGLYQHFFRWQHLSSVFSLLPLSLSLRFLFSLFPYLPLSFIHRLFLSPPSFFCSFLYFPLSSSLSLCLASRLSSIAHLFRSDESLSIAKSRLFANSDEFDVRSPSMFVQYFLWKNTDSTLPKLQSIFISFLYIFKVIVRKNIYTRALGYFLTLCFHWDCAHKFAINKYDN